MATKTTTPTKTSTPSPSSTATPPKVNTPAPAQPPVNMSAEDKAKIKAYQDAYKNATTAEARNAAHAGAEGVRAGYNFSGGEDGSQYNPLKGNDPVYVPPEIRGSVSTPSLMGAGGISNLYGGITYDENAMRAKFDAATKNEYDAKRYEYDATANKFYNQLDATGNMALDTIRKGNAKSIATGASKGIQAANEVSAILGLEQTSNQSATDLAVAKNNLTNLEQAQYSLNAKDAMTQSNQTKLSMGNLDATLYGIDTQLSAAEMQYYSNLYNSMKTLEGTKYNANQNVAAQQAYANGMIGSAQINAGAQTAAARIGAGAQSGANSAQTAYYQFLMEQEKNKAGAPSASQQFVNEATATIKDLVKQGRIADAQAYYAKTFGNGTLDDSTKESFNKTFGPSSTPLGKLQESKPFSPSTLY